MSLRANARGAAVLAGLTLCVASVAVAEPMRDEATGLSVTPPPGYVVRKAEGDPRYAAVYAVQKGAEEDTGCKIAFQPTPTPGAEETKLTQEDINAFTRKKEWTELIRATLALRYDVASVEAFDNQGLSGAAVVADFKPVEGEAKPPEMRSYLVVIDTPKGRTTIVCVGDKAGFDGRKAEFEAIARSVTPPR